MHKTFDDLNSQLVYPGTSGYHHINGENLQRVTPKLVKGTAPGQRVGSAVRMLELNCRINFEWLSCQSQSVLIRFSVVRNKQRIAADNLWDQYPLSSSVTGLYPGNIYTGSQLSTPYSTLQSPFSFRNVDYQHQFQVLWDKTYVFNRANCAFITDSTHQPISVTDNTPNSFTFDTFTIHLDDLLFYTDNLDGTISTIGNDYLFYFSQYPMILDPTQPINYPYFVIPRWAIRWKYVDSSSRSCYLDDDDEKNQ